MGIVTNWARRDVAWTSGKVGEARCSVHVDSKIEESGIPGPRSLSEKQVKVDKDLRRAAAERFFVFRGIPHFVPGGEIRKSLLEFGLILGQPPSLRNLTKIGAWLVSRYINS